MVLNWFKRVLIVCCTFCGWLSLELSAFESAFFDTYRYNNSTSESCRMDVVEKEKEYVIEVEVPGIKKEDIDLSYSDSTLVIVLSSKKEHKDDNANYLHRERSINASTRSIRLDDAKFEKARAKIDNGILTIKIPREKSHENYKKIKID